MSKLSERIAEMRVERYLRSTEDQSWGFFSGRVLLFFLVGGSVVSSWAYFVLSVAKWDKAFAYVSDRYQGLALTAMLACYFGLRKALARIATAPVGSLDERDLELRNDAFRMAYLVIRRVGLGVLIVSLAVIAVSSAVFGDLRTKPSYFDHFYPSSLIKWLSDSLVDLMDSGRGVWILLSILITLTYCAYSFPLVILGWRQALRQKVRVTGIPEYANFGEWAKGMKKVTSNFVKLMTVALLGFFATLALEIWIHTLREIDPWSLVGRLPNYCLQLLVAWCEFVYVWSFLSMLRARHLFRSAQASHLKAARRANNILLIATPLMMFGCTTTISLATVLLAGENFGIFAAFAVLAQLLMLAAIVGPSVAMVGATVATRKKPVVAEDQNTSQPGN